MPAIMEDLKPRRPIDAKGLLMKPLGGLLFRAKLLKAGYEASGQARQEIWGVDNQGERQQERRDELFAQRRIVLVAETIDRGEGSRSFLSKLAMEYDEMREDPIIGDFEVPDYPDFSETSGLAGA